MATLQITIDGQLQAELVKRSERAGENVSDHVARLLAETVASSAAGRRKAFGSRSAAASHSALAMVVVNIYTHVEQCLKFMAEADGTKFGGKSWHKDIIEWARCLRTRGREAFPTA